MTDATPSAAAPGHDSVDVVRHEERLRVGTETVPIERVRLERVVVTEQRTVTIDVSHEEIRLHREPVSGAAGSVTATRADRQPIVVILSEEQVEITKRVVPVERVTLHIDVVTDEKQISETVRREQIDVDPAVTDRRD